MRAAEAVGEGAGAGAAAAAAAVVAVEVAVVVAAVSALPETGAWADSGSEVRAAGCCERWTGMLVVAPWGALSQRDLQMQQSSFSSPEVMPAGIFPC